jgi:hypothetical protein
VRSLEKYEELLLQRALDLKKMQRYARNVLKSIPKGNRYSLKTRLFGAIGMAGEVRLDTYSNFAGRVYLFSGLEVCGYKLLKMIAEGASERKNSVLISYRPLDPKTPEGLLFEDSGIAFIVGEASACEDTVKRVNMRRFLLDDCGERRAILRRYKELQRMKNEILSAAENAFKEAREHHFELEEIYKKHMDFKALSAFCDGFCEKAVKNIK